MTSHNVRQMHECTICGKLGFYKLPACAENLLVVAVSPVKPDGWRVYAHPRCFRKERGLDKLLALPKSEMESIRLCDVTTPTMRAIMRQLRQDEV